MYDRLVPRASPVDEIADRLHSAAIHLLRRVRREDDASGVPPARLSALSVLVFRGPVTLGELAAAEGVKPPTMTRIVDGLVEARLARRRPRGRTVEVTATAEGRRVLERARRRRLDALVELLETLDARELETLRDAASLIERALASGARE